MKQAWEKKSKYWQKEEISNEALYEERAGIWAEFGKVVVCGMGYFHRGEKGWTLRLTSIASNDEKQLLEELCHVLSRFDQDMLQLCAHNGKQFDFPFLSRRMLIHGIPLPQALDLSGKKPWEVNHMDTMEMWRFGDFRHYVSLELLAALFNIESSKSAMDGSQVGDAFYHDNNLADIATYCIRDVEVTARVFLHLTGRGDMEFTSKILKNTNNPDHIDE
jgi:predicted PolB exonuclease-like 3'-5' exonuclease